jgi:hypothetical protein
MRHVPTEPRLRKALPWLAAGEPEVFNAYQQSQGPKGEKQLTQASYLASFIGHKAGQALFVGLYQVNGYRPISHEEFWKISANRELQKLGMIPSAEKDHHHPPSGLTWRSLISTRSGMASSSSHGHPLKYLGRDGPIATSSMSRQSSTRAFLSNPCLAGTSSCSPGKN